MEHPHDATTTDPPSRPDFDDDLPPGNHAVEIAARAGFGPLSPLAKKAWHGDAAPCVSCGQLVRREEPACEHCGQDLSEEMIDKMRGHAGPWFVLEHLRPFPGVSLERVIRQIRRGLITETSIVRGPSTDYQWRFAVETPGLCRYFGRCWHCHNQVSQSDTYCQHCLSYLSFERPRPVPATAEPRTPARATLPEPGAPPTVQAAAVPSIRPTSPAAPQAYAATGPVTGPNAAQVPKPAVPGSAALARSGEPIASSLPAGGTGEQVNRPSAIDNRQSPDLARLAAAARQAAVPQRVTDWDQPPRVAGVRATWIAAALMLIAVITLLLISRARSDRPFPPTPVPAPSAQPAPSS